MSYCVNCGVKLDAELTKCPLCNTPVINPAELEQLTKKVTFPDETGQPEKILRKDWGLLLTIVLSATSISCGLLNAFVFVGSLWSLLVIGLCVLIWVSALPTVIYLKMSIYLYLLFDGFAAGAYLYMISFVTPSINWFTNIALPITALVTLFVIIITFLYRKVSRSFLAIALYIFVEIPILCVFIELLIENYYHTPPKLTWSAVVLTACAIICIMLITALSKKRFREAIRRRLHF